jgi:hypothetical protein
LNNRTNVCVVIKTSIRYLSLSIHIDNQALKAAAGVWPLNPERPDYDLITDIRAKIRQLPITIHWQWVEGHQDNTSSKLDKWAKANVMADHLAKAFWNQLNSSGHTPAPLRFGDEGWSIHFQGQKLNRLDKTSLYQSITDPASFE